MNTNVLLTRLNVSLFSFPFLLPCWNAVTALIIALETLDPALDPDAGNKDMLEKNLASTFEKKG